MCVIEGSSSTVDSFPRPLFDVVSLVEDNDGKTRNFDSGSVVIRHADRMAGISWMPGIVAQVLQLVALNACAFGPGVAISFSRPLRPLLYAFRFFFDNN